MVTNKTLDRIDYSELEKMNRAGYFTLREFFGINPIIVLLAFILLCVLVVYFIGIQFVFAVIILPIVIMSFVFLDKVKKQKNAIWEAFAQSNYWEVIKNDEAAKSKLVPPAIWNIGRNREISPVIHARVEEHQCYIFVYKFTTGHGKSQEDHFYTVAKIPLEKQFPHLVLDSKYCYSTMNKQAAVEPVKLEGDFAKTFTLYHDKGEQIDALSIITPDVMESMLAVSKYQDIEIIDDTLYLLNHSDKRNVKSMQEIFKSIDVMADEIKHKAKTINYTAELNSRKSAQKFIRFREQINAKLQASGYAVIIYAIGFIVAAILMFTVIE